MSRAVNPCQGFLSLNKLNSQKFSYYSLKFPPSKCVVTDVELRGPRHGAQSSSKGTSELVNPVKCSSEKVNGDNGMEAELLPHVQTLKRLPKEELVGKVVMVRFDSSILLDEEVDQSSESFSKSVLTIKYLRDAGAKVILASEWCEKMNSEVLYVESVAAILSTYMDCNVGTSMCISRRMQLSKEDLRRTDVLLLENLAQFKGELSNSTKFAELLSQGIDIFVNDSFSQSHKILASTVGISRFCYASMAGFYFEKSLCQLRAIGTTSKRPCIAIVGGGNLQKKAAAIRFLASRCDVFIFVGRMAYQIMHALRQSVPLYLVQHEAHKAAKEIVKYFYDKSVQIVCPKDVWCVNSLLPAKFEIFPSNEVLDGWAPIDLGPSSLNEIHSLVMKSKVLHRNKCNINISVHHLQLPRRTGACFYTDNRWRMLQRSLVEAIADLLSNNGKIFLQSDIESVAVRMKEEFLKYGKDKVHVMNDYVGASTDGSVWMKENPFGVRSDWEQHVLDRGCQMYRLMLSK